MITCQTNRYDWCPPSQQPTHGEQEPLRLVNRYGTRGLSVQVACGCDFLVSWVSNAERKFLERFPKPTRYVGQPLEEA